MEDEGIAVIVPVWNRRDLVEPLLANLRAQAAPPEEIVVVDNGSSDGAAEAAEAAGARVVRMGRNAGFAAGQNTLLDGTWDVVSRAGTAWRAGHGQPDGPAYSSRRAIYSAPWTAALFRAELFEIAGGLDETFESYLEDVEFGVRCARLGYGGVYVPAAVAWHQGSATLGQWHPDTVRRIARNQLLLVARHFPRVWTAHVLVGQLLWGGVAWRHGAGGAWLRGKREALEMWQSVRSTYSPKMGEIPAEWLQENERMLRALPSRYWKLYSLLTPREA